MMLRTAISMILTSLLVTAPAGAQTQDTLRAVISNGVQLTLGRHAVMIEYHEDGTYSGQQAGLVVEGNWRVEGESLCVRSDLSLVETCTVYPPGKRPGDTFEVTSPALGQVSVTIRE